MLTNKYSTNSMFKNYIMSNCRKVHHPYYNFEKAFNRVSNGVSCERISRIQYELFGVLRIWMKTIEVLI